MEPDTNLGTTSSESAHPELPAAESVSVSTTFYPNNDLCDHPPDVIFRSSDHVSFFVHTSVLLSASVNGFGGRLPIESGTHPVLAISEPSEIFNIVVHTAYHLSSAAFSPAFESLQKTVDLLPSFGILPKMSIVSGSALYDSVLSHIPRYPLKVYVLAASHDLYELAAAASSHLLSISLDSITDAEASAMGPVYLKRLFILHLDRTKALKRLLTSFPTPHAKTPSCSVAEQQILTRDWALACSSLLWDVTPGLSAFAIQSVLQPLESRISCDLCVEVLHNHIQKVVSEWTAVKLTI